MSDFWREFDRRIRRGALMFLGTVIFIIVGLILGFVPAFVLLFIIIIFVCFQKKWRQKTQK